MSEEKPRTAVTWVYEHSKHKGNVQYVLVTLAIAYTEKGACLSMKEIARRTGISQATVRRALDALEEDGTIQIIKNGGEKRGNGVTNCYRFPAYEKLQGDSSQVDTSHHETPHGDTSQADTPAINAVPHASAHGDAAGEKDLSLRAKEKDKKTPLPAKAGKESADPQPEKPPQEKPKTPAGQEWADLIAAIGEVFKAFGPEALNYANMLIGKSKKGDWSKCNFEVPVTAAELRRWRSWYHQKNQGISIVKEPPKVHSSITEWRNQVRSRPPQPVSGFDGIQRMKPVMLDGQTGMHQTIPESELERLRPSWKVSR